MLVCHGKKRQSNWKLQFAHLIWEWPVVISGMCTYPNCITFTVLVNPPRFSCGRLSLASFYLFKIGKPSSLPALGKQWIDFMLLLSVLLLIEMPGSAWLVYKVWRSLRGTQKRSKKRELKRAEWEHEGGSTAWSSLNRAYVNNSCLLSSPANSSAF